VWLLTAGGVVQKLFVEVPPIGVKVGEKLRPNAAGYTCGALGHVAILRLLGANLLHRIRVAVNPIYQS
jgi:hypothetical protein